jgi:hypothetical protein
MLLVVLLLNSRHILAKSSLAHYVFVRHAPLPAGDMGSLMYATQIRGIYMHNEAMLSYVHSFQVPGRNSFPAFQSKRIVRMCDKIDAQCF